MWRQGMFVLPFMTFRVSQSWVVGQLAVNFKPRNLSYEGAAAHTLDYQSIVCCFYLALGYGDLELFRDRQKKKTQH
jgi:hypothetical protein